MCTLTWFVKDEGYELFFNRDERNTRSRAQPPTLQQYINVSYLSPTDTDAGGTWITVNHFGVTVCLLNYYRFEKQFEKQFEQSKVNQDWISRGEIVRELATSASLLDAEHTFETLDLKRVQAFRLFIIDVKGNNRLFIWNGKKFNVEADIKGPKSSSSVNTQKVKASRYQLFDDLKLGSSKSPDEFLKYHASHDLAKSEGSAQSVCMHRDDANTVSFSHIDVSDRKVSFAYIDGSPCSAKLLKALTLDLM